MIRLGTILLHKRAGPLAAVLSFIIRFVDPDPWVRKNYKIWSRYWHMSFVKAKSGDDWVVESMEGGGAKERFLSSFPAGTIAMYNWLPEMTNAEVAEFISNCPVDGYDGVKGYVICALNRRFPNLIPAEADQYFYCWQRVDALCWWRRKPWMEYGRMAYMPLFVKGVCDG